MQPRQLLGVFVRAIGLALLFISFNYLLHLLAHLTGIPILSRLSAMEELWAGVYYFGTGFVLTRGAEWIVRFAYGPKEDISN
jgi:hypothetical protein